MSSYKNLEIKHEDIEGLIGKAIKRLDPTGDYTVKGKGKKQINYDCTVKQEKALIQTSLNNDGTITLLYGTGSNPELSKKICLKIKALLRESDKLERSTPDDEQSQQEETDLLERLFPTANRYFCRRSKVLLNLILEENKNSDSYQDLYIITMVINLYITNIFKNAGVRSRFKRIDYYFQLDRNRSYILSNETTLSIKSEMTRQLIERLYIIYKKISRELFSGDYLNNHLVHSNKNFDSKEYIEKIIKLFEHISQSIEINKDLTEEI